MHAQAESGACSKHSSFSQHACNIILYFFKLEDFYFFLELVQEKVVGGNFGTSTLGCFNLQLIGKDTSIVNKKYRQRHRSLSSTNTSVN